MWLFKSTTSVHVDLESYVRTRACEKRESGKQPLDTIKNAQVTTIMLTSYNRRLTTSRYQDTFACLRQLVDKSVASC